MDKRQLLGRGFLLLPRVHPLHSRLAGAQRKDVLSFYGSLLYTLLAFFWFSQMTGQISNFWFMGAPRWSLVLLPIALVTMLLLHVTIRQLKRYRSNFRHLLGKSDIALRIASGEIIVDSRAQPSAQLDQALFTVASNVRSFFPDHQVAFSVRWLVVYYIAAGLWSLLLLIGPIVLWSLALNQDTDWTQSMIMVLPYLALVEMLLPIAAMLHLRRIRLQELAAHLNELLRY